MTGKKTNFKKKSVAFLYTKNNHTEEEIMDPPIYSNIKDNKMSWNKPNQGGEILQMKNENFKSLKK